MQFITDCRLGETEFTSRQPHGTPEERGEAITRGFEVACTERRKLKDAISLGLKHALA
jgi:hypothetical protein